MAYIDNLLDWGDMLFSQYTMESINEARMLYVQAYDLLGTKPENLGTKILTDTKSYSEFTTNDPDLADELLALENEQTYEETHSGATDPNSTVMTDYFLIPENDQFMEYWNRVEDRLSKIRRCLNIDGVEQALPLFQPPIDPMALVQAASGGGGIEQALAGLTRPVPHYRFNFMLDKAQQLVQKLNELSSDLLTNLEKKDSEALNMLQARHEGLILNLTRDIKKASILEAQYNIDGLKETLHNANIRKINYSRWVDKGLSNLENEQLRLINKTITLHTISYALKLVSAFAYLIPDADFGPFIIGVTQKNPGDFLAKVADVTEATAQVFSSANEAVGVKSQNYRSVQDWQLQKNLAESDIKQINAQIEGAKQQLASAKRDADILEKQIKQNDEISGFYKNKYSNDQLYIWMAGKISGLYFQYYKLALDMAKYAERAFQFERGIKETEVNFIQPAYWDSRHKGLLAGHGLAYDLDRMQKAFIETDARRFEISKQVSMLELDPMQFLKLKANNKCEFSFTEALFDYDFQGHYNRQIKTITIKFVGAEGEGINATLTQLSHKTVLEADTKAVKYLLSPKDQPPLTIRNDWKASQQIALSYTDPDNMYEKNNGMFELNFSSDRYLPFEGTGAVSDWLLELGGKRGSYDLGLLTDVIIHVKYTALQGGKVFAQAVKGLLKPYPTSVIINVAETYADAWKAFMESDSNSLDLTFMDWQFPNMSSNKVQGIFSKFDLDSPAALNMIVNGNADLTLRDGRYIDTPGLTISSKGTKLSFDVKGDKYLLSNFYLVMMYKAQV
jgi:Tc toxin complex TcA C-terminal TcB-binding domain